MEDLENFNKDDIDSRAISEVEKIINHPDFQPDKIKRSNLAAFGLSMWVRAMYRYDKVIK